MKRRIALIEEASPVITISIHQNSYPEEYVKGPVFYYRDSADSRMAAEIMQKSLKPEWIRKTSGKQKPMPVIIC